MNAEAKFVSSVMDARLKKAKREQSKEEQAFFRACNRIGMSDIQIYRLSQIMEEETERK